MDGAQIGRITQLNNKPHYGGDSADLRSTVPTAQNEIARELDTCNELSNAVVSELSTLAAVLDPILMPEVGAEGKEVGNPTATRYGAQLSDINNRLVYAIKVIRSLRNNAAI